MLKNIFNEFKHHAPFTFFGAITGIIAMLLFQGLPYNISYNIFYILHPIHVLLSALVTASMYANYKKREDGQNKCNLWILLIIGYVGSIGIATLSDSLIPIGGNFYFIYPIKVSI